MIGKQLSWLRVIRYPVLAILVLHPCECCLFTNKNLIKKLIKIINVFNTVYYAVVYIYIDGTVYDHTLNLFCVHLTKLKSRPLQ